MGTGNTRADSRLIDLTARGDADAADVVVFLGTAWNRLEAHNTRWRSVLQAWAASQRVARLRVVSYPGMSIRNAVRAKAVRTDSWDPRIEAVVGRLPVLRRHTTFDGLAWRVTARALEAVLPSTGHRRVLVASTPLWAPVLPFMRADRRGFDAVDDWRALASMRQLRGHVVAGYRAAASLDTVTTVSAALTSRLAADFGIAGHTVPNGVEVDRFAAASAEHMEGLPAGSFALYVGVVEDRVDLALLAAARAVMPVVVAGPSDEPTAQRLRELGLTWIGAVDQARVPALMRAATVGLLPHRSNALTESMDPMKTREYLAAGLPIVTSVGLADTGASPRVLTAVSPQEFEAAVRAAAALPAIEGPDPHAHHRSWREVADELLLLHL